MIAKHKDKLIGVAIRLFVIIVLLLMMDFVLGSASAWLYHRAKYGIFHRQQYVLHESNDRIIILGSSRASHHYVPSIIADSLGMSCYNAGSEGMCVYYHYAMLSAMIERGHYPDLVLYDVMDLDTREHPGPTFTLDAALDRLAPHYGEYQCIDSLFGLKGWKEWVKLHSKAYRYNSKLVQSIKCNFIPSPEDKGYEVVVGRLSEKTEFRQQEYDNRPVDSMKVVYLEKMAKLANRNGIKLIFIQSPKFSNESSRAIDTVKQIAKAEDVLFLDFINEPELMKRNLFRDVMHLNDEGAHVWSSFLAHELKRVI